MDDIGASLLINSREQIFTEKLHSLLKFGSLSTRYKDIFDMCYLLDYVDSDRLLKCITTFILEDKDMWENDMDAVRTRISKTFTNRMYKRNAERSGKSNWVGININEAFKKIEDFLRTL